MPHNTQLEKLDNKRRLRRFGRDTPIEPETEQLLRDTYCHELDSIPQIWKSIMQNMEPAILDHFTVRIRNLAASLKPDHQSYNKVQMQARWVKFLAFHYTHNEDTWDGYPWIFDYSYRLPGLPPLEELKGRKALEWKRGGR